jgi:GxxExxY protein
VGIFTYNGDVVGKKRVDFLIDDTTGVVLVEIKAKAKLEDVDFVQALSYLKASGEKVGLLINFWGRSLEVKRMAN